MNDLTPFILTLPQAHTYHGQNKLGKVRFFDDYPHLLSAFTSYLADLWATDHAKQLEGYVAFRLQERQKNGVIAALDPENVAGWAMQMCSRSPHPNRVLTTLLLLRLEALQRTMSSWFINWAGNTDNRDGQTGAWLTERAKQEVRACYEDDLCWGDNHGHQRDRIYDLDQAGLQRVAAGMTGLAEADTLFLPAFFEADLLPAARVFLAQIISIRQIESLAVSDAEEAYGQYGRKLIGLRQHELRQQLEEITFWCGQNFSGGHDDFITFERQYFLREAATKFDLYGIEAL